jgi:hypothetical protein
MDIPHGKPYEYLDNVSLARSENTAKPQALSSFCNNNTTSYYSN